MNVRRFCKTNHEDETRLRRIIQHWTLRHCRGFLKMPRLIFLRHGRTAWIDANLFTGWIDVPLNEEGRCEAVRAGELFAKQGCLPDVVHTSFLQRAISTATLAMRSYGRQRIPVKRAWQLNERHYGALQGRNKAEVVQAFGHDQVSLWRRSYDVRPPEIERNAGLHLDISTNQPCIDEPSTESLKDVLERMLPYWELNIVPYLIDGKTVLVVAHGTSLRALTKVLCGISDKDISKIEIPTGVPIVYELDENIKPRGDAKGKPLD